MAIEYTPDCRICINECGGSYIHQIHLPIYTYIILYTSYLIETVILLNILYICICLLNITVGTQDLTVCVVVIDF